MIKADQTTNGIIRSFMVVLVTKSQFMSMWYIESPSKLLRGGSRLILRNDVKIKIILMFITIQAFVIGYTCRYNPISKVFAHKTIEPHKSKVSLYEGAKHRKR
ncbi:hypothetical protein K501DRAFT_277329 [Backusella circina FSU 941]|nr:hypothetical protein K501DRAFT_277329 [Backusella circina FSU 941]